MTSVAGKFTTSSNVIGEFTVDKDPIIQDTTFFSATNNWMNFQPGYDGTFQTTMKQDFDAPDK